jgi:hypothetical protein
LNTPLRLSVCIADFQYYIAARSWTECEECGRELVFHPGGSGSVIFLELR